VQERRLILSLLFFSFLVNPMEGSWLRRGLVYVHRQADGPGVFRNIDRVAVLGGGGICTGI